MNKPPRLAPHIVVRGGLKAIEFYEEVLDADTQFLAMADDGKLVMHAALEINDGIVYLCDDFGVDGAAAPKAGGASVMIHLQLKKPRHVDAIMQKAVEHGAEIVFPAEDAFWGDRYGQIRDPFGHVWTFGAALKGKDQMQVQMTEKMQSPPKSEKPAQKGRARSSKK
jgi:PhnB protein